MVLWVGFIDQLGKLVTWLSPVAPGLSGGEKLAAETPRQIANAHSIFNVVNTLVFLPFAGQFARLAEFLVPDEETAEAPPPGLEWTDLHLDPALLIVPAVALGQVRGEVRRMAYGVHHMLAEIMPAFIGNDTEATEEILQRGQQVDELEGRISDYLVQISRDTLTLEQSAETRCLLNITKDLEHIGDVVEKNLIDLLRKKATADTFFSAEGQAELQEYHRRVLTSFDQVFQAFDQEDAELANTVATEKVELVELEWAYRLTHYDRLSQALPESLESSQIHLDLVDYLRRINSYTEAIARSLLGIFAQPLEKVG